MSLSLDLAPTLMLLSLRGPTWSISLIPSSSDSTTGSSLPVSFSGEAIEAFVNDDSCSCIECYIVLHKVSCDWELYSLMLHLQITFFSCIKGCWIANQRCSVLKSDSCEKSASYHILRQWYLAVSGLQACFVPQVFSIKVNLSKPPIGCTYGVLAHVFIPSFLCIWFLENLISSVCISNEKLPRLLFFC